MGESDFDRKKAPTMADVARRAGVSTAAVSYLLSGDSARLKFVGKEARQRILEAVNELNYVQNRTARQLRRRQAERICLLLPRLGVPFSDRIAQDVQSAVAMHGFSTIIAAGDSVERVGRIVSEVESGLADGLIADWQHLSEAEISQFAVRLAAAGRPAVIFHPSIEPASFSVVRQHTARAVSIALDYLHEAGHRRIAYMLHDGVAEGSRVAAYYQFLQERNLPFRQELLVRGAEGRKAAFTHANTLLALEERPTALFAESDLAAVTALHAFEEAGLSVPDDIAVIGCGNVEEGEFSHPPLTTIGPETTNFKPLADHLVALVTGAKGVAPTLFDVPWRLVRRASA
ncbi:LacI family DNA-binding transcriptional regulator [Chelativorans xinjiangense]|uniref:LacI family DNA-binding transcriptional regulator n=1 Tax=Chelativorans xinjiangense TaxID=2681485 RepID=UPI00135C9E6D|nr:LacI family DNA-binding transcriptional regulator [Chelativorans xinjiangense]